MVATTKRHPSRTRHRTGVDARRHSCSAMDIDFVIDGGAYCTLSPVVLSRGTIHAAGPYLCPNVRMRSRAVATNTPPHGAFRGFGAPQSLFALERHMNRRRARSRARRRTSSAGATSSRRARRAPPARSCASRSTWIALLDRALDAVRLSTRSVARFARANPGSRDQEGHRLRDVHARRRLHRLGRGAPRVGRRRRGDARTAACACSRPARRSARARTRSSRRSPPTRSASTTTTSRSRSPTPRTCPTAGRRSRRARAWSSASWSRRPRAALRQTLLEAGLLARAVHAETIHGGVPRRTSRRTAPLRAIEPATSRRPASRWDDETYRATRTAPTPGPCTSPR